MGRSLNGMLVKRITYFPFCMAETWQLRRRNCLRKGGEGKPRACLGGTSMSLRVACWLFHALCAVLSAHHFAPAISTADRCAQTQSVHSSMPPCTLHVLLSAQLLCLQPPEAHSVMEEPKTCHLWKFPPPIGDQSQWVNTHPLGLGRQFLVSFYILHQNSEQKQAQLPTEWASTSPDRAQMASHLFPQRIGLLNDQLNFRNLPNLTIHKNPIYVISL